MRHTPQVRVRGIELIVPKHLPQFEPCISTGHAGLCGIGQDFSILDKRRVNEERSMAPLPLKMWWGLACLPFRTDLVS